MESDEFETILDAVRTFVGKEVVPAEDEIQHTDRAVQIHGGMGYMSGVPVEGFYRDARLLRLYEGTSEIQKLIIAKQLIKGVAA